MKMKASDRTSIAKMMPWMDTRPVAILHAHCQKKKMHFPSNKQKACHQWSSTFARWSSQLAVRRYAVVAVVVLILVYLLLEDGLQRHFARMDDPAVGLPGSSSASVRSLARRRFKRHVVHPVTAVREVRQLDSTLELSSASKPQAEDSGSDRSSSSAVTSDNEPTLMDSPFSNITTLNFLHLHKTGGVFIKTLLYEVFSRSTKLVRSVPHPDGQGLGTKRMVTTVRDSCYMRKRASGGGDANRPTFEQWRCDWEPLLWMGEGERMGHDVVFGHQYLGGWDLDACHSAMQRKNKIGCLLSGRDVRTWTLLRHPLDRKVSFYFHFFARERGRDEGGVPMGEVISFLLREGVPTGTEVGSDAGPNYVAGRLLLDGRGNLTEAGSHAWYDVVGEAEAERVVTKAKKVLDGMAFVGLQEQVGASLCMLAKTVGLLDNALGLNPPTRRGVEKKMSEEVARLKREEEEGENSVGKKRMQNGGRYTMDAESIWNAMTEEQRVMFREREWIDLAIYEHGKALFARQAKRFGCAALLVD